MGLIEGRSYTDCIYATAICQDRYSEFPQKNIKLALEAGILLKKSP